jgi:hypothetical protein
VRRALIAAVIAGCGGGDAPDCDATFKKLEATLGEGDDQLLAKCKAEKWSGALRSCLTGVKDEDGVIACFAKHSDVDRLKKSKDSEAERNLAKLERALKARFAADGQLPLWQADRTPATPCCESPGHRCAPDPLLWSSSPWFELEFSIDDPHDFQYELEGSDTEIIVRAIGDLDCDGTEIVYELTATVENGALTTSLTRPGRPD